jgi:type VI secretion system secreted protein Hcp
MAGALFLKLDGIDGEATDEAHTDEINILNYNWGVSNPTTVTLGGGTSAGKVSVQDLVVSKFMDKASPNLMKRCCSGEIIKSGVLTVQRAGGDKTQALVFELEQILVSSYQTSGDADSGQLPIESATLSFNKVKYKYTSQDKDGAPEAEVEAGWDVEANAEV